jgi:hypothetical protein
VLSSLFGQETAIKAKIGFLSANENIVGSGWKKFIDLVRIVVHEPWRRGGI